MNALRYVVVAVALAGCGAAPAAPPRSAAAQRIRAEMRLLASPVRSATCERALDAFGERLGPQGVTASDELRGVRAACAPADGAAAEAVLDERERQLAGGPASADELEEVRRARERGEAFDDFCRRGEDRQVNARVATVLLDDDQSALWTEAQRCAAALVPRTAAAITVAHARAWSAAGDAERLAACLDRCALTDGARIELERLEQGNGYERRIRRPLDDASTAVPQLISALDAPPIATALAQARDDIRAHERSLGARAAVLDGEAAGLEQRLAARLPAVAEVELINLSMRAATALDVVDTLIPDPIDVASASAEVNGSREILEHMRAVVAAASAVLKSAAAWTGQIDAFDQRFRAVSARIDARIERRLATLALLADLCRLDRDHDAAAHAPAALREVEEQRRARLKQLRGYKGRYDRRRDCAMAKP